MELCSDRKRRDAVVEVVVVTSQEGLLRTRHCKAQAMDHGCGHHRPIASGTGTVMDLDRMRGTGMRVLARLPANALEMMVLVKVHGRMLGTGRMVRVIQLVNAAGSGLEALARLSGNSPDFVVEELETLPGTYLDFALEELARLLGIDLVLVVEELEMLP